MNILIVEDDQTIAMGISYSLQQEQFVVDEAYNKKEALEKIATTHYDLYLLDLTLPDGNGYEICKKVKEKGDIPVIFLTACDDEVNVVMGLDMGADDYITKPFRIRELISRIKSVMRRYRGSNISSIIELGVISVNIQEAKVYRQQKEVALTALEYRLLIILINHRGQVLTRNQLLEELWDISGDYVNDNTLTVYIKRLREKLEDNQDQSTLIETVRGIGYRLK